MSGLYLSHPSIKVNDGKVHRVIVTRSDELLTLTVDGAKAVGPILDMDPDALKENKIYLGDLDNSIVPGSMSFYLLR